jgi:hypothetical protein
MSGYLCNFYSEREECYDFFFKTKVYQNCGLCTNYDSKTCTCTVKSLVMKGVDENYPGNTIDIFNTPVGVNS